MGSGRIPRVVFDILDSSQGSESMDYVNSEISQMEHIFKMDEMLKRKKKPSQYVTRPELANHLTAHGKVMFSKKCKH